MKINTKIRVSLFLALFLGLSQTAWTKHHHHDSKSHQEQGKEMGEKLDNAQEKAKEKSHEAADSAKEKAHDVKDKAKDLHKDAKDKAHDLVDKS